MQKKIEIKDNYFFGRLKGKNTIILIIRNKFSNLFFTLADYKKRVIECKTTAMILGKNERRRRRKAPQTIEYMVESFSSYFDLYDIRRLVLILKIRPGQYVINLVRSLVSRNIILFKIFNRRRLPFSSSRGRRKKY